MQTPGEAAARRRESGQWGGDAVDNNGGRDGCHEQHGRSPHRVTWTDVASSSYSSARKTVSGRDDVYLRAQEEGPKKKKKK